MILVHPLCAAWRLARYNAARDEEDHEGARAGFAGLPTTGAGAAAATGVLLQVSLTESGIAVGQLMLPSLLVVLGSLMVSRIQYRHAAAVVTHLHPRTALALAAVFVAASVLWRHEYLFAALMWGYVLSGPLATARQMIRAARHA
jgi:phosphatidylserine synthase